MQGQLRSCAKYSLDAEIMEIFPTGNTEMERVRTTGDRYERGGTTYLFAGDGLERIHLVDTEIVFDPPLDIGRAGEGRVTMTSHPDRGHVSGAWEIIRDGEVSRLIVNNRSVFASWPQNYTFTATYDPAAGEQQPQWRNGDPQG